MTEPLVEVRGLTRIFGTLKAVDGISFDIFPGQVVGFIGENGAGKTTTMRMMVTLDLPDAGSVKVKGFDAVSYPNEVRKRVGWMPDSYGAYDFMDVGEYMDFFARAYGYTGKERDLRIGEVMAFTELDKLADRPVNTLSKGQAQRLCLGRTLLPDPELLVLDEPAAGLDPRARIEVKNLVRILAGEGKTLFISSHILSELEQMCDAMLFISGGRIMHQGSSESLKVKEGHPSLVRVRLASDANGLEDWISFQAGVELFEWDKQSVRLKVEQAGAGQLASLLQKMVKEGFPICGFEREEIRLEDAFVDLLSQSEGGKS
ncbi:MAG: ABC transporter ATP-binding protein [Kiritimatiellae bacterium]|jgi:ABC-2 type transport system ATP-binding protein|nr:ABC transporter ATP-binding protein [Kiritimatiellia bacterium]